MTTCSTWDPRRTNAILGLKSTGTSSQDVRRSLKIKTQNLTIDFVERFVFLIITFKIFSQHYYNISFQETSLRDNPAYEQDSKVQFVIDAVYAFAFALQKLKKDVCPRHRGVCQRMKSVDGGSFYKDYLLKTSFIGEYFLLSYAFPYKWFCWSLALGNIYNIVVKKFCF